VVLFAAASLFILVVTVPVGLLTSIGLDRAISLGFYGFGAFLVILGFLGGSRGPFRSNNDYSHDTALRRERTLRRATRDELYEAINGAAVVIGLGLALLVLGVIIDSRYTLF
jgi:hypothetical protein